MTESGDIVLARAGLSAGLMQSASPVGTVLTAIKRRWLTMIVVTVIAALASLSAVWAVIKPKYEVSASVHIAQVVKPVLFSDPETDISRQYNVYMATQAQALASPLVIQAALNVPEVRSLPMILGSADPVAMLQARFTVDPIRGTELLRVSMTGENPTELATIINNVLRTFIRLQDDRQRDWDEKILSSLRSEQAELAAKLEAKGIELRQLAVDYGLGEAATGEDPAGAIWNAEIQRLLTQATKDAAIAAARVEALAGQEVISPGGILNETEYDQFRQQDPQWQRLSGQLGSEPLTGVTDAQLAFGPRHPALTARSERVTSLKEAVSAREAELRELFKHVVRRRLENQRQDAEMTITVLKSEWDRLTKQREQSAVRAVVLEDVRHERERLEQALSQVRQKIWNVQVEQNRMARITIDSPAVPPPLPNINKRFKYAAVAMMASLFLGTFAALVRHRFDTSVRTPVEVIEHLGLPFLGTVQYVPERNGSSVAYDKRLLGPIRAISTALLVSSAHRRTHYRLITSPTIGSGKSLLAANLARSLATTGRRVLLVDADNYGQGLTRSMKLANRSGLKELLEGTARPDEVLVRGDTDHLDVLPAGQRSNQFPEFLATKRSEAALRTLFESYDEVVVDSPPVLAGSTAIILATLVDEIVFVLRAGVSTREHAQAARQCLSAVGDKIVGVILNAVDARQGAYGYYYHDDAEEVGRHTGK